jgi:hypothetical protein
MRRIVLCVMVSIAFLFAAASSKADGNSNIVVPAGTLLRCTLDEPNFSSATADIGDPVVCHLSSLRLFGQNVLPRGSYLGGHLEADKEPGHFWGKGYLKIEFDRIGFPTTDVPVPSKTIATKSYRVDKKGDIVGKGHPKRDVVEWLIPPLWPWKILTLPARGPRPALKGETQITVRLMDDIEVPRNGGGSYRSYDAPANRPPALYRRQDFSHPASDRAVPEKKFDGTISEAIAAGNIATPDNVAAATTQSNTSGSVDSAVTQVADASSAVANAETTQSAASTQNIAMQTAPAEAPTQNVAVENAPATRLKMIALKSQNVYGVTKYHINGGSLSYVLPSGATGSVDLTEVDWRMTSRLNGEPLKAGAEKNDARPMPTYSNLQ